MVLAKHERCGLCRTPFVAIPRGQVRYGRIDTWDRVEDECRPCKRAEETYDSFMSNGADADYVYHEVAHAVMLWGRVPTCKRDWVRMDKVLDKHTMGRAQVHEMRTLAMQGQGYAALGWKPSWERLVHLSWGGIREVDDRSDLGTFVVKTETAALRYVKACRASTSKRKIETYVRALRDLRGTAT